MTAEETAPRAEPRQGYEKATGAVQVVQVMDEPDGAGSRPSAPSAPKTAPNRPALKSRTEPATQAPQRAGSKPHQPKHVCQKKWALLEDLQLVIHKANSKGATDLLYDYLGGGSFKQRRTDFHKLECCKGIPCVGNWTVAMLAHLLAGTTLNSTKQAKVYGDAVEGWISDASEPDFEELTGYIAEGLTLSSLLERIPRLMYEAMSWQITMPQLRAYLEEYYGPHRKSWSTTKGSRPRPLNPAPWHSSRAGKDHRPHGLSRRPPQQATATTRRSRRQRKGSRWSLPGPHSWTLTGLAPSASGCRSSSATIRPQHQLS